MKENWTVEIENFYKVDCLIIVSNYFNSNEVINYPFPDLSFKSKFDIGVWKIKQKK